MRIDKMNYIKIYFIFLHASTGLKCLRVVFGVTQASRTREKNELRLLRFTHTYTNSLGSAL